MARMGRSRKIKPKNALAHSGHRPGRRSTDPKRPHMSERPPADIAMDEALLRSADVRKRAQVTIRRSRELYLKSLRLRTRANELLTRAETQHAAFVMPESVSP